MITKFKHWLLKWLGLERVNSRLSFVETKTRLLHEEFWAQIKMVGVDVAMKDDQTIIIFVSRLGDGGSGTVRIIPARFKSMGELREFIRYTERSFDPDKISIDAPSYIVDELRERKYRR
jgi:hypothetical protein